MYRFSVAVRISFCFLVLLVPLTEMDEWFYDHYFRFRGPLPDPTPIVILNLDDVTLPASAPKVNWPLLFPRPAQKPEWASIWKAKKYREVAQRILALDPKLVVFTSHYLAKRPGATPHIDQDKVVFASLLDEEGRMIPPFPRSSLPSHYGFNTLFPDADNRIRKTQLGSEKQPSLALQVSYRLSAEKAVEAQTARSPYWIDFRGPAGSFPTYTVSDLYHPKNSELFRDKIVLIGKVNSSKTQFADSPMGPLSRVEVQANILDTLLNRRDILHVPRSVTRAVGAVAILLSLAVILAFPLYSAWLSLLLLAAVILVVALFLFAYSKIWFGVANPIVCVFVTHFFMMGYKLGRQEEKQHRIEKQSEELRELDEFKNNFISLFSHDLKTPIAKIKAISDRIIAENPNLPPQIVSSLDSIRQTNRDLARFISDILKVTRLESMSFELKKEVIDLNRLVEQAISRNRFLAEEKRLEITLDIEPLFAMEGDEQLIEEVISNLLENAIKYSPPDTEILVRTREEGERVTVAIIDQGPGIATEELPRITSKFYRGKTAETNTKGSGLGLYLAKYFVELHSGGLAIESSPGKGTSVSFWLPLPK